MPEDLFLGLDIGTGGVRGSVIDARGHELAWRSVAMPPPVQNDKQIMQDAQIWLQAAEQCLHALGQQVDFQRLRAISVDGTSASVLLCRDDGAAMTAALMYNDSSSQAQAARIAEYAPPDSTARGASSSLAKLLHFRDAYPKLAATHLCHQADFVSGWLSGRFGVSDENNCLKLGYDAAGRRWPDWLQQLDFPQDWLPQALRPGEVIGAIHAEQAKRFGIAGDCLIIAGTTDSIAAFIASGADQPGDAVTSLGSTLVLKQLTTQPVFSAEHGIYSHRYYAADNLWLAGGASNCGGRVLQQLFSQEQLDAMTPKLQPNQPTGLRYYPLPLDQTGERFPLADAQRKAELSPRPDDDVMFFQGILESLADIEAQGYALLASLGAGKLRRIFTAGGGGRNRAWHTIRGQRLPAPVLQAEHSEASYGAARLALHGWRNTLSQQDR